MLRSALVREAVKVIHKAIRKEGILALATTSETENYTRVWARDSIMTGYAGILVQDSKIVSALKSSLQTLGHHQSDLGIIPSNVSISSPPKVSYGGTAGRVDATLWYIIGVCLYTIYSGDEEFYAEHRTKVEKALTACRYWEYNHKYLIYTPLSGNWADEYPIHGYTLYDNCLRLWGLELYATLTNDEHFKSYALQVRKSISKNFFITEDSAGTYHPLLYSRTFDSAGKIPYPVAGFNPSRYYTMFDCGGVGLALLLQLFSRDQVSALVQYISDFKSVIGANLVPAFWPPITPTDDLWADIEMNYAYQFKNQPHHFHNGGVWPIMMGWLAQGLAKYDQHETVQNLYEAYAAHTEKERYAFSEYIASDSLTPGGKSPLCYSASGAIMMEASLRR